MPASSLVNLECGYRVDLLVEGRIILELKSIEALAPVHDAIVLTYLRLSGCRIGLLINFNVAVLKVGIKRFLFDEARFKEKLNTEVAEAQRSQRKST